MRMTPMKNAMKKAKIISLKKLSKEKQLKINAE
jgi:hypothetical protein